MIPRCLRGTQIAVGSAVLLAWAMAFVWLADQVELDDVLQYFRW